MSRRCELADFSELHHRRSGRSRDGEHRREVAVHGHHDEIVGSGVINEMSDVDRLASRSSIGFHGAGLTAWYLLIVGLVAQRFWDYWSTLLP